MSKEIPKELLDLLAEIGIILATGTSDYKFFLMAFPEGGIVDPKDGVISSNASRDEVIRAMKVFIENCEKNGNEAQTH